MEFEEMERLEPWGPWRDNWHMANIATLLANVYRRKGAPAVKVSEFMFKDPVTAQEEEEMQFLNSLRALKKSK